MVSITDERLMAIGGFIAFVLLIVGLALCCRWRVNRRRRRQEEALQAYASDKSTKNSSNQFKEDSRSYSFD